MAVYEESLLDYMYSKDFIRVFRGKCPDCGAEIWNVGEEFNLEKSCIKAKFICNCGKKYKQVVFSKKKGYSYRYPQGIVEYEECTTKDSEKVIKQKDAIYRVTPKEVIKEVIS